MYLVCAIIIVTESDRVQQREKEISILEIAKVSAV